MNTASNLRDTIEQMRQTTLDMYPERCLSWTKKVFNQTGQLLLADAVRQNLVNLKVTPNCGEAYCFKFEINLYCSELSGNPDLEILPVCFTLIVPCGNGMVYDTGIKLGFCTDGDLYCHVDPNRYKGKHIPENISCWKL